jgi:hypothetical protein
MVRPFRAAGSFLATLTLLSAFAPNLAAAQQTSVIVLGIRSVEGDDTVANNLSGALRNAAGNVNEWDVADAEVSLAQMSMAHGCDEPDAACMAEISGDLGQQRTIYGTVRRTGAGAEYDFALTLYFYNAESGQIEDSLTDTIPRIQQDIDDLRARADRYVSQFAGQARFGSVRVHVNQAAANVELDGASVGVTDGDGVLLVEDVTEGQHELHVSADGYDTFVGTVRVVADEQSDFRGNLVAESSANLGWIPGAAMIVVGGVLAGVGISSWAQRNSRNSEGDRVRNLSTDEQIRIAGEIGGAGTDVQFMDGTSLSNWQIMVAAGQGSDVCAEGAAGAAERRLGATTIRDECDQTDKYKRNAIIFNVLGLAIGGTGIALLMMALTGGGDDDAETARLRLTPSFGRRGGGFSAALDF